jgi:hypothetical protein
MADVGIKKVRVLGASLPPLIVVDQNTVGKYYLKFRITSEDRSKRSEYSPISVIPGLNILDIEDLDVEYQYYSDEESFRLNWTTPNEVKQTRFDVYVKWAVSESALDTTAYTYTETVSSAQTTLNIPAGANYVQIRVQIETAPHILNNPAKVLETVKMSTAQTNIAVSLIDGGSIA